jgi:hypothetical protein
MFTDKEFYEDLNEIDKDSEIYKHFKPLIESFPSQIFLKRLAGLTELRMTLGALIILSLYMKNPGICAMYAYYLYHKLPPNTLITLDKFSINLFPWGMFSKAQLDKIWDAQKRESEDETKDCTCIGAPDNLLDYLETWKS